MRKLLFAALAFIVAASPAWAASSPPPSLPLSAPGPLATQAGSSGANAISNALGYTPPRIGTTTGTAYDGGLGATTTTNANTALTNAAAAQTTANAAIPQSAIGSTVAPLVGSVVPPANLPAATTSSLGAVQCGTGIACSGGTASVQYGTTSTSAAAGNDVGVISGRGIQNLFTVGGVACDGTTNQNTAVNALNAAGGGSIPKPSGSAAYLLPCVTTINPYGNANYGPFYGLGRLEDSSGNLMAPTTINLGIDPVILGNYNASNPVAAFNYDASHQIDSSLYRLGPNVGNTGISNYVYADWLAPHFTDISLFGSGTGSPLINGRTMIAAYRVRFGDGGYGDTAAFNGTGIISTVTSFPAGTRTASRKFLPANGIVGGTVSSSVDNTYLNLQEMTAADNGHDVGAAGPVIDLNRSNATEGLGQWWIAFRDNTFGSMPSDASYSAAGPHAIGLQLESISLPYVSAVGNVTVSTSGTGICAAGDILRVSGGTFVTPARIKVVSVNASGIPLTAQLETMGNYTSPPSNPVSITPELYQSTSTCTDTTFNISGYEKGALLSASADQRFYLDATNNEPTSGYPNSVNLGTEWFDYDATNGFEWYIGGNKVFSFTASGASLAASPASNDNSTAVATTAYVQSQPTNALPGGRKAGVWYPDNFPTTTGIPVAGRLIATAVRPGATLTSLAVNVTATTGGSFRLGVYADNGSGAPGALLYDSGVQTVGATGIAVLTPSLTSITGTVWLAFVDGSITPPTMTTLASGVAGQIGPSQFGASTSSNVFTSIFNNAFYSGSYSDTTIATALPGTFGTATAAATGMPQIAFKP